MKVLLFFPASPPSIILSIGIPIGILAVATFLEENGHEVRLYDRSNDNKSITKIINEFNPEAVGISIMSPSQYKDAIRIAKAAKSKNIPLIWGGHMASMVPKIILQSGLADYVGISEGEYTVLELLDVISGKREPESVKGIYYIDKKGEIVSTPERPFADLSDFPSMDYSLLNDIERYFIPYAHENHIYHSTRVYYSKGCPFKCTFCINEKYHRCQYRKRPHELVLQEIKTLVCDYGVDRISFTDELFGANRQDLREFCSKLKELNLPFDWQCQNRIGQMNREDIEIMYDAGCRMMSFGIESGSPEVLKRIKKSYNQEQLDETIHNVRDVGGIGITALIIIGLPDETVEEVSQTIRLIFRIVPDMLLISFFAPLHGSYLYNQLKAERKIVEEKDIYDFNCINLGNFEFQNFSKIPSKDLKVIQAFFYWDMLLNKRNKKKNHFIAFKTGILVLLANCRNRKLSNVLQTIWHSGIYFLQVLWYAHAYPSIRKKYDLYAKNFGRENWDD